MRNWDINAGISYRRALDRSGYRLNPVFKCCFCSDMEVSIKESTGLPSLENPDVKKVCVTPEQGTDGFVKNADTIQSLSPIKDAKNWAKEVPADAKEFTLLFSNGMTRRIGLLLTNENGEYDTIEVYKSKKDAEPYMVLHAGEYLPAAVDETIRGNKTYRTNRSFRVLDLAKDGSYVRIYSSDALDIDADYLFHPQSLYKQVIANAGFVPAAPMTFALSKRS